MTHFSLRLERCADFEGTRGGSKRTQRNAGCVCDSDDRRLSLSDVILSDRPMTVGGECVTYLRSAQTPQVSKPSGFFTVYGEPR